MAVNGPKTRPSCRARGFAPLFDGPVVRSSRLSADKTPFSKPYATQPAPPEGGAALVRPELEKPKGAVH